MGKEKKHKEHKTDKREKYEELPVSRPPSLKLVLKVGGSPVPECSEQRAETPPAPAVAPLRLNMAAISEAETHHKERKHKKKKKKEKEKHKHKKDRRQQEDQSPGPETGRESRQSSGTEEAPSQGTLSSPEPSRALSPPLGPSTDAETTGGEGEVPAAAGPGAEQAAESAVEPQSDGRPPLRRFLEHLLRGLQEKDTRGFFSVPVTDDVAPGYSSIIDTPMDFSTIAGKVRDGQYANLAAFKEDFRLMCCNAMTYNRMDTIYYRTAKRLLHIGSKMMSSDKVIELRSVLPYMASLSPEVLGVEAADLLDHDERPPPAARPEPQPAQKMEAEPSEPAGREPPAAAAAATEPPVRQVKSEPAEPGAEPMAVDVATGERAARPIQPTRPAAAADAAPPEPVRQTRRQTRGADPPDVEMLEVRQTRQTRGGDQHETEVVESRPKRQTRGGDPPDAEVGEGRAKRQTRAAEKPESERVEGRQTRQGRALEQTKTEPESEPETRQTRQARAADPPEPEPETRQTRQARAADPPEPEPETRQTRQARAADAPEPEPETRQTRQARAADAPEPEPETRQTRRSAVEPPKPAPSRSSGQDGGACAVPAAEPMDTSEAAELVTSNLIMKQPHLVLEKIDAAAGMKFQRGPPRPVRRLSAEETAAARLARSSRPSQPPQSPQRTPSAAAARPARVEPSRPPQTTSSGKLGFLRQRLDGTTSLAIVTPSAGGERPERVATLGALTGRLAQGAPHLPTFRDDKRNQAKPVKPLYYGAYSSFAPSYDSTFATISYSESELLFETLAGGPSGQQLEHSVRQAADDCDVAIDMVDSLLDALTDGQHRRLEQRRRLADEVAVLSASTPSAAAPSPAAADAGAAVDYSSLRTLGELGIDVGFLDRLEAEERRYQDTQGKLDHTSELISSLNAAQLRRLSQPPETVLPPPSQQELQLADEVSSSLTELVKHVQPGQVAPPTAIRKAIGVGPVPDSQAGGRSTSPADTPARQPPQTSSSPTQPSLRTLLSRV